MGSPRQAVSPAPTAQAAHSHPGFPPPLHRLNTCPRQSEILIHKFPLCVLRHPEAYSNPVLADNLHTGRSTSFGRKA